MCVGYGLQRQQGLTFNFHWRQSIVGRLIVAKPRHASGRYTLVRWRRELGRTLNVKRSPLLRRGDANVHRYRPNRWEDRNRR